MPGRCSGNLPETLAAEPRFLGILRAALDEVTTKLVIKEVGVSLTRDSIEQIQQRIDNQE